MLRLRWGYYKYGGMDEQALLLAAIHLGMKLLRLDQACEVLGKFPCRLEPKDWKSKTYSRSESTKVIKSIIKL